jgi:hypothetical protein
MMSGMKLDISKFLNELQIKLGDLLRYAASGAVFLSVCFLAKGSLPKKEDWFVWAVITLLVGALIYLIHRGLIYPFLGDSLRKRSQSPAPHSQRANQRPNWFFQPFASKQRVTIR